MWTVDLTVEIKLRFQNVFTPTLKHKAGVFKFLRFEERFQKALFLWRLSVDGRPSRRSKGAFSNSSSVVWMGPYIVCVFFWFILFLTFTKWQGSILRINCWDIEDITCPRGDTNFILDCSTRYLTSERRERVRYWVEHEKIKVVSTSGHVIFCLLYKHTNDDVLDDFPRIFWYPTSTVPSKLG